MDTSVNSFRSNDGLNLDTFHLSCLFGRSMVACVAVDILTASNMRLTSLT